MAGPGRLSSSLPTVIYPQVFSFLTKEGCIRFAISCCQAYQKWLLTTLPNRFLKSKHITIPFGTQSSEAVRKIVLSRTLKQWQSHSTKSPSNQSLHYFRHILKRMPSPPTIAVCTEQKSEVATLDEKLNTLSRLSHLSFNEGEDTRYALFSLIYELTQNTHQLGPLVDDLFRQEQEGKSSEQKQSELKVSYAVRLVLRDLISEADAYHLYKTIVTDEFKQTPTFTLDDKQCCLLSTALPKLKDREQKELITLLFDTADKNHQRLSIFKHGVYALPAKYINQYFMQIFELAAVAGYEKSELRSEALNTTLECVRYHASALPLPTLQNTIVGSLQKTTVTRLELRRNLTLIELLFKVSPLPQEHITEIYDSLFKKIQHFSSTAQNSTLMLFEICNRFSEFMPQNKFVEMINHLKQAKDRVNDTEFTSRLLILLDNLRGAPTPAVTLGRIDILINIIKRIRGNNSYVELDYRDNLNRKSLAFLKHLPMAQKHEVIKLLRETYLGDKYLPQLRSTILLHLDLICYREDTGVLIGYRDELFELFNRNCHSLNLQPNILAALAHIGLLLPKESALPCVQHICQHTCEGSSLLQRAALIGAIRVSKLIPPVLAQSIIEPLLENILKETLYLEKTIRLIAKIIHKLTDAQIYKTLKILTDKFRKFKAQRVSATAMTLSSVVINLLRHPNENVRIISETVLLNYLNAIKSGFLIEDINLLLQLAARQITITNQPPLLQVLKKILQYKSVTRNLGSSLAAAEYQLIFTYLTERERTSFVISNCRTYQEWLRTKLPLRFLEHQQVTIPFGSQREDTRKVIFAKIVRKWQSYCRTLPVEYILHYSKHLYQRMQPTPPVVVCADEKLESTTFEIGLNTLRQLRYLCSNCNESQRYALFSLMHVLTQQSYQISQLSPLAKGIYSSEHESKTEVQTLLPSGFNHALLKGLKDLVSTHLSVDQATTLYKTIVTDQFSANERHELDVEHCQLLSVIIPKLEYEDRETIILLLLNTASNNFQRISILRNALAALPAIDINQYFMNIFELAVFQAPGTQLSLRYAKIHTCIKECIKICILTHGKYLPFATLQEALVRSLSTTDIMTRVFEVALFVVELLLSANLLSTEAFSKIQDALFMLMQNFNILLTPTLLLFCSNISKYLSQEESMTLVRELMNLKKRLNNLNFDYNLLALFDSLFKGLPREFTLQYIPLLQEQIKRDRTTAHNLTCHAARFYLPNTLCMIVLPIESRQHAAALLRETYCCEQYHLKLRAVALRSIDLSCYANDIKTLKACRDEVLIIINHPKQTDEIKLSALRTLAHICLLLPKRLALPGVELICAHISKDRCSLTSRMIGHACLIAKLITPDLAGSIIDAVLELINSYDCLALNALELLIPIIDKLTESQMSDALITLLDSYKIAKAKEHNYLSRNTLSTIIKLLHHPHKTVRSIAETDVLNYLKLITDGFDIGELHMALILTRRNADTALTLTAQSPLLHTLSEIQQCEAFQMRSQAPRQLGLFPTPQAEVESSTPAAPTFHVARCYQR